MCTFTLSKFLGKKVPLLYPLRFVVQFTLRYMLESWVLSSGLGEAFKELMSLDSLLPSGWKFVVNRKILV